MGDVILENFGTVNDAKLDEDIRAAIGGVYNGHSGPRLGKLVLHFTNAATSAEQAQAQSIALAHDPLQLTADQQSEAARVTNTGDVKTRFNASALANKTPQEIYDLMQGQVDGWTTLADAQADLRKWLPLMAAAVAWLVVKERQN